MWKLKNIKPILIVVFLGWFEFFFLDQEKDARDIEIPNIRWDVFELMMRLVGTLHYDAYDLQIQVKSINGHAQ